MKKFMFILLTLVLSISILSGCSKSSDTASSGSGTATKQEDSSTESSDEGTTTAKDDSKKYTIGISQIAPHGSLDNCREGFIAGLAESGYVEGENVTFDYQNASGETANATMISESFVSKNYDLICAIATPTAMAAYTAASETEIPVIFTAVSDPVASELVESLDAPGNNCTGTSDALPLEQQVKMIRAFLPDAKKLGVLYTTSEVNSLTHLESLKSIAPNYGFEVEAIGVTNASDIPLAMDTLVTKVDCITNFTDNNVVNNLDTVLSKANEAGIPVFGSEEEQVKKGCVAAQNIDYYELGKETGRMAAQVLEGAKASEMPVKVISECTTVANQAAMDSLGLTMPSEYADMVTYLTVEK
jgi:putative ABC transport system substrate-binding protein